MRQNKQMEVAVVSVEQLHQEFEWMKEQLKKEILLDVKKLGSKELLTRQQLADYLSVSKQTIINWPKLKYLSAFLLWANTKRGDRSNMKSIFFI